MLDSARRETDNSGHYVRTAFLHNNATRQQGREGPSAALADANLDLFSRASL